MGNYNCSQQEDNVEYTENFTEIDNGKSAILIQKQFRRLHTSFQVSNRILKQLQSEYLEQNIIVEKIPLKDFNSQINQAAASTLATLSTFDVTIGSNRSNKLIYELNCLKFTNNSTNQIECYHGQWSALCRKHGIGILITSNSTLYYGNFNNGIKQGRGVLIQSNGDYYQGYFDNDIANGKGVLNISTDYVYNGEWKNNCKHGTGIEIYKDGSKYEGDYENNERHGHGKYNYSNGSYYEGEFKNGLFSGNGKLVWKDGRKYVGEFEEGKLKGKGLFTWPNGSQYEGEYNDQMKEGKGEFKWKTGKTLIGHWFRNKPHGKLYISNDDDDNKNMSSYSAIFRFGKLINSNSSDLNSKRQSHLINNAGEYSSSNPL